MGTPVKLGVAPNIDFVFSSFRQKRCSFSRSELFEVFRGRAEPLKLDSASDHDVRVFIRTTTCAICIGASDLSR